MLFVVVLVFVSFSLGASRLSSNVMFGESGNGTPAPPNNKGRWIGKDRTCIRFISNIPDRKFSKSLNISIVELIPRHSRAEKNKNNSQFHWRIVLICWLLKMTVEQYCWFEQILCLLENGPKYVYLTLAIWCHIYGNSYNWMAHCSNRRFMVILHIYGECLVRNILESIQHIYHSNMNEYNFRLIFTFTIKFIYFTRMNTNENIDNFVSWRSVHCKQNVTAIRSAEQCCQHDGTAIVQLTGVYGQPIYLCQIAFVSKFCSIFLIFLNNNGKRLIISYMFIEVFIFFWR